MELYINEISNFLKLRGRARADLVQKMFATRAEEIKKFLQVDGTDKILTCMHQTHKLTKRKWEEKNPQDTSEILDFYKESQTYIYELTANECDGGKMDQISNMLDLIGKYQPKHLLVYGSGTGSESIPIKEQYPEINVEAADVPSLHHKFACFRAHERGLAITPKLVKENSYGSELEGVYDMIVCFDVLEHVADPEALARNLMGHLKDNGILLAVFMFNKDSGFLPEKLNTHPLHITHNKEGVLLKGAHFKAFLKHLGFKCEWAKYGSMGIKVLRKPQFYEFVREYEGVVK